MPGLVRWLRETLKDLLWGVQKRASRGQLVYFADLGNGESLRLLTEEHTHDLFDLIQAHRAYLGQWLSWVHKMQTPREVQGYIRAGLQRMIQGKGYLAGIWSNQQLVGVVGYNGVYSETAIADLAYWLVPSAQGRGLASRALRQMVQEAFTQHKMQKVELRIYSQNPKSIALAQRLGFRHEGTRRRAEKLGQTYIDHHIYGLLPEELR